jgi:threonine/homoserine/homoserine lactone efflux protein
MIIYALLWIVYGLISAVLVGQSFFVMIHTSSKQWFGKSLAFLLWANITDLLVAWIAYYAVGYVLDWVVGINIALRWHFAAIISIILGIFIIMQKVSITQITSNIHVSFWYIYSFLKGCLVNMSWPLIWITWLTVASYFTIQKDGYSFSWFVIWSFVALLTTDIIKAYHADKIMKYMSEKLLKRIQRTIGIIIIVIGIVIRHRVTLCADDIDSCLEKTQQQLEILFDSQ